MNKVTSVAVVALALGAGVAIAQTGRGQAGNIVRHRAPTDQALDFPLATLQAEFADMKAQKRVTTRLMEGGTYSLNARYIVGAETAQLHKSILEFYFVREGTATLVTGGTIVDGTIRGGVTRPIKAGDVVFIPPGVPHGVRDSAGLSYLNVHYGSD
jgi:mannose-6-phosphate isomerase-like protein (cupin superfamily)